MADTLPLNFPIPSEGIIASYDYLDIADGIGYVKYFACKDQAEYFLTRQTIPSDIIELTGAVDGNETPAKLTLNFDVEMKAPRTLKGRAYAAIPAIAQGGSTGAGLTHNVYYKVYFKHYDGSTETTLGSGTSATKTITGSSGQTLNHDEYLVVGADCTQTDFAIGDKIRITLEIYAWQSSATYGSYYVGIDPLGRTTVYTSLTSGASSANKITSSYFLVPFKVNP